jgi:hypothetical protein
LPFTVPSERYLGIQNIISTERSSAILLLFPRAIKIELGKGEKIQFSLVRQEKLT